MAWIRIICCRHEKKYKVQDLPPDLPPEPNPPPPNDEELDTDTPVKQKSIIEDIQLDINILKAITEIHEKDDNAKDLIKQAIRKNDFLNNMMDASRLEAVTLAMYPQQYEANQLIIREGDIGTHVYVSADGIFDVVKNNVVVSNFGAGVAFGELGILFQAKRFASVRAKSAVKVWILKRTVFNQIMSQMGRLERQENCDFLKSVDLLKDLPDIKLHQVADLLKRELYAAGTSIVTEGDVGDKFYIIRANTVKIVKRYAKGQDKVVNTLKRGDFFGEQALINCETRTATVIANPPGTECLTLDRRAFEKYLGPLDLFRDHVPNPPILEDENSPRTSVNTTYDNIKLSDLKTISTLGVGSYGRVELVECNKTNKLFALKYLKKHEIVELNYQNNVYSEKNVMVKCENSFIVKLYKTYRNTRYVYFLMEPCLGGDLWAVLHENKYFDKTVSRFVAACVIEALAYMHKNNLIYRDLKPENLMLSENGYIKLVDFGFAKEINPIQKTWTFAGTPEYVAPEIILNKGYDRAADIWAIGILIHELLTGRPVFRGQNHAKTFNLIVHGIDSIEMPLRIQQAPKAMNLIKQLCRQNPTERLGYAKNGFSDIRDHGWFSGFNWNSLRNQTMSVPRKLRNQTTIVDYPRDESQPPEETSGWDIYF